nr:hypothetical protein BaRGS_004851 [Batillaria attramentaria]
MSQQDYRYDISSQALSHQKTKVLARKRKQQRVFASSSGVSLRSCVESMEGSKAGAIFITHEDGDEDDVQSPIFMLEEQHSFAYEYP